MASGDSRTELGQPEHVGSEVAMPMHVRRIVAENARSDWVGSEQAQAHATHPGRCGEHPPLSGGEALLDGGDDLAHSDGEHSVRPQRTCGPRARPNAIEDHAAGSRSECAEQRRRRWLVETVEQS